MAAAILGAASNVVSAVKPSTEREREREGERERQREREREQEGQREREREIERERQSDFRSGQQRRLCGQTLLESREIYLWQSRPDSGLTFQIKVLENLWRCSLLARKRPDAEVRSYTKRVSIQKKSGNAVYYTESSLLVILKHSCSKLHCQKFFKLRLFSYQIFGGRATKYRSG